MAATRYRDLERPALIDTTPLETGNSQAATALAHAFKQFEGIALEPAANARAQQGQQEGTEAGANGTPEFRAGVRAATAYGAAYNNSAMRSYAVHSEADAEDQAARLELEAQNDPDTFAATFSAVRDETMKHAPPQARGTLATIYDRRLQAGVSRLSLARADELNKTARADTAEGVARLIDKAATLHGSDDIANYEEAIETEVQLGLLIDGAASDGTITQTEAVALHKNSQRQLLSQTVSARFRRVLDSPSQNPVDFIEKLRKENKTNEALSPKEEDALVDQLIGDLKQHNALMAAGLTDNNAAMRMRYEVGDREATAALFTGELTTGKLREMIVQQRLDPGRATSLANELASGDKLDDTKEAFHVRTNLQSIAEADIASNRKLSWKTRGDLILKRREEAETWKGTQVAREANDRIERALGIAPGTNRDMLKPEEAEQLDQAKTTWYNEVDKLPPAERQAAVLTVAEDVVGRFIRKGKANEAQNKRKNKATYIKLQREKFGPPDQMDEQSRKKYNERLSQYDADIAAAEAEAARK